MSTGHPEEWFDADIAAIDVETTGLNAAEDRVIEIAIIHMRSGEVIDRYSHLVNPGIPIPEEVIKLTGIQNDDIAGKPAFAEIAADVRAHLEGKVVVAYNLSFDKGFVTAELERAGTTWPDGPMLDPLVFAREFQRNDGSKRLEAVAKRLGIELTDAHRAAADAEVGGRVLYAFRDQLPTLLTDIIQLQQQWSVQQEQQMAAWRRRRAKPTEDTPAQNKPVVETPTTPDKDLTLGPAYIYGTETDPVRHFYQQLPDVGSRN
jgi:DNA polymerase-3 subunit epsilon